MSTGAYADFSSRVYEKTYANQVPSHGHFELTFRCPLKCVFCYCSCYTDPASVRRELGTEEVKRILDEAAAGGCLWMTFSGGDPFVRPDFREIYDHARSLGMIISIFCSGLVLTEDWLQHLQVARPLKIELPIYGVTKETYEAVAGKQHTFERAIANIKRMVEAGLPVKLKSKLTTLNVSEAEDLERFVEGDLGLSFHPNYYLYPRLNRDPEPVNYRLSSAQIRAFEAQYGADNCESGSSEQSADEENPSLFRCAAGINSFYINPYGELNFCTYVRQSSWDLRRGTIREGVAHLRRELLTLTHAENSACRSCAIQSTCQNCPGHAALETGALAGKSDYLCDLNHELRGKEVAK